MSRFAEFRAPSDAQIDLRLPPTAPHALLDPRHIEITREGLSLRVTLRRNANARGVNLKVLRRNGEIVMTLPPHAELGQARAFAECHFNWIARRVADVPPAIAFAPGSVIPLRGEPCLIVSGRPGAPARLARAADGSRRLKVDPLAPGASTLDYLKRVAAGDLAKAVSTYARRLGVRPAGIRLKDTKARWGSCTESGMLNFSWRLALAPRHVLDYLAAHETAHLRELNHSPAYWRLVYDVCPHTDAAEAWLRDEAPALYRYG